MEGYTRRIVECIKQIPCGKVSTYGAIARHAGDPRGARQVARVLHSLSDKESLPWHRVVNRQGEIALLDTPGYAQQRTLLENEGVVFQKNGRIDLEKYGV